MKPPKKILCADRNELEMSIQAFVLRTRGFRVTTAATPEDAVTAFCNKIFDVVIIQFALPMGDDLTKTLKRIDSSIPVLVIADLGTCGDAVFRADGVLDRRELTPESLIARIKVMCARKRGPRKKMLPARQVPRDETP